MSNAISVQGRSDWKCTFRLRPDQKLYTAGDVHGDLLALVRVLKLTTCVRVTDEVLQALEVCPVTQEENARSGWPLTQAQFDSICWYKGKKHYVALLGDVLDNRRGTDADPWGVCGKTGTQTMMLQLLVRLKRQAQSEGGDVLFVLGNHDVANLTRNPNVGGLRRGCGDYAPHTHLRQDGTSYATCQDADAFSAEHVAHMLELTEELKPVAVARVDFEESKSVLLVHGGVDLHIYANDLRNDDADANLQTINRFFVNALWKQDPVSNAFLAKHVERLPTWCRPAMLGPEKCTPFLQATPQQLQAYLGASRLVKGHDTQTNRRIRCAQTNLHLVSGPNHAVDEYFGEDVKVTSTMEPGQLCFTDIKMSRAFGREHRHYEVLQFWKDPESAKLLRMRVL